THFQLQPNCFSPGIHLVPCLAPFSFPQLQRIIKFRQHSLSIAVHRSPVSGFLVLCSLITSPQLTLPPPCETLHLPMRVTAKGEYATQAVLHLTRQYPDVVTIQDIAQRHHIPLKYLEQILLELKHGGILESRRGVRGGYTLARNPNKIFVGEVL